MSFNRDCLHNGIRIRYDACCKFIKELFPEGRENTSTRKDSNDLAIKHNLPSIILDENAKEDNMHHTLLPMQFNFNKMKN